MTRAILFFSTMLLALFALDVAQAAPQNMLANPGLEGKPGEKLPPQWDTIFHGPEPRFTVDGEEKHGGSTSVRIDAPQSTRGYVRSQAIEVAPGEILQASVWVKTNQQPPDRGTTIAIAEFSRADGGGEQVAKINVADPKNSGWQLIEGTATVPPNTSQLRLRLGFSYSGGTSWWDDVTVTAKQPLVARLELPSGRLSPALEGVPVTIINRDKQRDQMRVEVKLGSKAATQVVALSGEPLQHITVPLKISARGKQDLELALRANGKDEPLFVDRRSVQIPPPIVLLPIIPTHWAIEDGPAKIEGRVELAVPKEQLDGVQIIVSLLDQNNKALAESVINAPRDNINDFVLNAQAMPEGEYKVVAELKKGGHGVPPLQTGQNDSIRAEQPWSIIPRRLARVVINDAGFPEYDGKAIFPLGMFNGGARVKEMGEAGFTVNHAYNAVRVFIGDRPDDQRAKDFLDSTAANGMKALFLVPQPYVHSGDWDSFRRRIRMFRNHPALLAWDEEEGHARGDMKPGVLEQLRQVLLEEDPHHPFMTGDSRDVASRMPRDRSDFFPQEHMDMGMWWWYPIPLGRGKADLLEGAEMEKGLELAPPTFLTTRITKKPVWVGVQSYKKPQPWGRYPNPAEYRAQAYIAIIHGAKGLMWYGGSVTGGLFLNPDEGHWPELQKIVTELRSLSDVFMSETGETPTFTPSDVPISVMLKQADGRDVIIAVNRGSNALEVTLSCAAISAGKANVIGEDRSIDMAGSAIKDHFEAYAVHVYELKR